MSKRLDMFDKLLATGSRDPFHHYARAMELRSLGREADALAAFSAAIESFPQYLPSYLMAAQLAQALGQPDRARELCTRGIDVAKRAGNDHALSELQALLGTL